LIVLRDNRANVREAKHYNERDQKADHAELHYRNQIEVNGRWRFQRLSRTQLGRHLEISPACPGDIEDAPKCEFRAVTPVTVVHHCEEFDGISTALRVAVEGRAPLAGMLSEAPSLEFRP
jgi:hypothetical protein